MDENKVIAHMEGNRIDALSDRMAKLIAEARNKDVLQLWICNSSNYCCF